MEVLKQAFSRINRKGKLIMVINVFKEGNDENDALDKNNYSIKEGDDDSEVQKIKSHLDITYLKYVSDNIKYLLKLNITNDNECFEKSNKYTKE